MLPREWYSVGSLRTAIDEPKTQTHNS